MTTESKRVSPKGKARIPVEWRRVGYAVAIGVNVLLVIIVVNLVDWGWLSFITEDFNDVVPIAVLSLVIGSGFYLVYMFFDPPWVRLLGDAVTAAIGLAVLWRTWQVWPFEFETGPWEGILRAITIFVGIAMTIGLIANVVKLLTGSFETD